MLAKQGLHNDWYYAVKSESMLVVLDLSDSLDQRTMNLFEMLHSIENGVDGCMYGHALPRAFSTFEKIPFETNLFFDVEYAVLAIDPALFSAETLSIPERSLPQYIQEYKKLVRRFANEPVSVGDPITLLQCLGVVLPLTSIPGSSSERVHQSID